MAMQNENPSVQCGNLPLKVEGDIGDLQIEEVSDSEDDNLDRKHNDSRAIDTLSNLPSDLIRTSSVPVYGAVSVKNSENVQFGNNTYFNGPVTIKQIINPKLGVENSSYTKTEDESSPDDSTKNSKHNVSTIKKINIQTWHKVTLSAICVVVIGGICAIVLIRQNRSTQDRNVSPDHSNSDADSNYIPVVGLRNEEIEIFVVTVITPLIILVMFYSLLTIGSLGHNHSNNLIMKANNIPVEKVASTCMYMNKNERDDPLLIAPDHLRIVSRTDWLAQPVENQLEKLRLPAPWVIITHTATENCDTQSACVLRVRLIQMFHIESRGWDDIGYNFLVAGDGSAYWGRGWDSVGAHTKGYNRYSIGIAFIGTFNNEPPPKKQVEACIKLIKLGVEEGKIAKDYKLFGHRQLMSTLSPGDTVFDIIKEWPHFVKNVSDLSELIPKYN